VTMARLAGALGAWLLGAACHVEPAAPAGDPAATIRAYFDAVAAADCPRLRANLVGPALERFDARGCQAVLDEHARHGAALIGVQQVRPDGREPQRRLVTIRMLMEGSERTVVVGVREQDDGFRIDQI
jgi:hypothetical protein